MGFTLHFYIIFGTNLLTGGPSQICCFMPISVFRGKGISNGVKMECNQLQKLFLEGNLPDRLGPYIKKATKKARGRGRAYPPGRALHPRGRLDCFLTCTPRPLDHVRSKNHAPEGFIPFGLRLIFLFFETLK